ncbi:MAG: 1,4-alpha-glucan branching protein GlgB [Myxococcota bacterium]
MSPTPLGDVDIYLFNEGRHSMLYDHLGGHLRGEGGATFAVWAPNADRVSVVGEMNDWDDRAHEMEPRGSSGIWEAVIPSAKKGMRYKYRLRSRQDGQIRDKADPFAFHAETPPFTASILWDLDYKWGDDAWMASRRAKQSLDAPISIYEVHLGSWRRPGDDPSRFLTYRELAPLLAEHVNAAGFSHVELLPVMEHPFYGSWGYQVTGYFAPTSRYGTPQDLMYLVDYLHQRGIGVILDWVPSHFPNDGFGLAEFDGTHLYEHADPRKGFHPDWKSAIFNYGRNEVRAFLLSSARFWVHKYRVDGLRVDAVASMLYLDYSRKEGEWIPNQHGGRENEEAISLLREVNETLYREHPDVQTIAEESTAWTKVSRPIWEGGLGFGFKWDMGWMHDMLQYLARDPVHRKYHQNDLTFRMLYAFAENFVLSLSHDEVVHGKGSLLGKMPGDDWQKLANLRLLFASMFGQPGKKLMFMGAEFAQEREWNHEQSLDWHLLEQRPHAQMLKLVADLNRIYRAEPALHELDSDAAGFEWMACEDSANSVVAWLRKAKNGQTVLIVANHTPVVRHDYRVGVPHGGGWIEILSSDATTYGGSGVVNAGRHEAENFGWQGRSHSLRLTLPPLGVFFLKPMASG